MKKARFRVLMALAIILVFLYWKRLSATPKLSPVQLQSFQQVINFATRHKEWGDFDLDYLPQLRISKRQFFVDAWLNGDDGAAEARKTLGDESVDEAKAVGVILKQISILRIRREGSMLLFYPELRLWELPNGQHGYVYSLSGVDPNKEGGRLITYSRPLEPIGHQWYYARRLAFGPLPTS